MPPINLSGGAIKLLFTGDPLTSDVKPVLQVAEITQIRTQNEIGNAQRYKILLSDSAFSHEAILDPNCSDLVRSGKLQKGSVIQLNQFMFDFSQNSLLMLIIDLDVLLDKCDLIGEPKILQTKRPLEKNQTPPRSIPTPPLNPYKRQRMTPPQPPPQFHFCAISDLEGMENGSIVDLLGVVSSISQPNSVTTKRGDETQKRNLQLKDISGWSVELTLWGNLCDEEGQILQDSCDSMLFPVLAIRSCRVRDFNGKVVWTIPTTQLFIEPDIPEANVLKVWFHEEGKNTVFISISKYMPDVRKTISQIKDERLGTSEKPDWFTVCATLMFIQLDKFYMACPVVIGDRQCNKKVVDWGDGKWRCNSCDRLVEECDYRYILKMQIQDHTGSMWITVFQESGEEILGISAEDLYSPRNEEQRHDTFLEVTHGVLFGKYLFKLKVKEEIFHGEKGVKSILVKAEKVDFQTESTHLLDLIAKFKMETSGTLDVPNNGKKIDNTYGETSVSKGRPGSSGNRCVGSTSRVPSTGSTGIYTSCNNYGGGGGDGPENHPGGYRGHHGNRLRGSEFFRCFKCHLFGHWARDCPGFIQ